MSRFSPKAVVQHFHRMTGTGGGKRSLPRPFQIIKLHVTAADTVFGFLFESRHMKFVPGWYGDIWRGFDMDLDFGSLASLALLLEAAKTELEHDQEAAKTSLATASSILQSEIERRSGAKGARTGGLAGWQIARVRSFVDKNLHRTIHASDLSAVARRSTAHFSRSFKQAFGEPPHAYVVRRRLEEACHLMLTSPASLSEIALSVGFSDESHLCKHFRQALGESPANWRRERKALWRC